MSSVLSNPPFSKPLFSPVPLAVRAQNAHLPRHAAPRKALQCSGPTDPSPADYSLNNPDTLTKYKTAGQISEKVLAAVAELCVPGAKIVDVCQKGDKLIEEETAKVYRGKKVTKGMPPACAREPAPH